MASDAVKLARSWLAGRAAEAQGMEGLPFNLLDEGEWSLARRVAGRLLDRKTPDPAARARLALAHARAASKDPELPSGLRLEQALRRLEQDCALGSTDSADVLGLAGTLHKRRWKLDGDRLHLEQALACYRRSLDGGDRVGRIERDGGATVLKTAYTLDLLAFLDRGDVPAERRERASARRQDADALRRVLLAVLGEGEDDARRLLWRAEAMWGLGMWPEAGVALAAVRQCDVLPEGELAEEAQRLARLLRLRQQRPERWAGSPQGRALAQLLGDRPHANASAGFGPVGLALAGRGMRAACFHAGVLARLAELDLLGRVDVISGTSGGAISAAQWFLELRRLLKTRQDIQIDRGALTDAVQRVATALTRAAGRDLASRVAASPAGALRLLLQPAGSSGNRLGEVLERELLDAVDDGLEQTPRLMNNLVVPPLGEDASFTPASNWRRRTRSPELVLVAAHARTGHAWHFTLDGMGEPADQLPGDVDGRARLREVRYQAGLDGRQVGLSTAVAAAASSPGQVDPVRLTGLYPLHEVDLCDGGLADPLALGPLLQRGCRVVIVADGGGDGAAGALAAQRLRQTAGAQLAARVRDGRLDGAVHLHLKDGLAETPVDWSDCDDPIAARDFAPLGLSGQRTPAGLDRAVQAELAGVRAGFGPLSAMDANMLMAAGYRIAAHRVPGALADLCALPDPPPGPWSFRALDPVLTGELQQDDRAVAVLRSLALRRAPRPPGRGRALLLLLGGWLAVRLRLIMARTRRFGVVPEDWRD